MTCAPTPLRHLALAADHRDQGTATAHSFRVAQLAYRLALQIGWTEEDARRLCEAALVHDVGKLGLPAGLLCKPTRLTPDEYRTVQKHAILGAALVERCGLDAQQVTWVRHHHERPDGRGYPDGVMPDTGAALLAAADSYDAMTSTRTYQSALPRDRALAEVRRQRGLQFTPEAVEALEALAA